MKPRPFRWPKRLMICGTEYRIVVVSGELNEKYAGICYQDDKVILISKNQTHAEAMRTLLHEVMHAWEAELKIDIGHPKIRKLEHAMLQLFEQL